MMLNLFKNVLQKLPKSKQAANAEARPLNARGYAPKVIAYKQFL